ncbi:hypothetical protein [Pseudopontixanthobacter vadosimaris]|uniref:hypothetical protein n=1 Tax=Pseudopontixanthobacter vadosimaris TaxID=2726450 RepID=UPI001476258E|nr:hypothetical protein [Pseudopontixanthobacter vadosimaris]
MKLAAAILALTLLAAGACERRNNPVTDERREAAADPDADDRTTITAESPTKDQSPLPPGEYRLAGVDGTSVDLPHAITVSISEDTIALASQCISPRWTYAYAGQRLTTRSIPGPICERGRYPAEEAAIAVLDSPDTIRQTPANGWHLTGGGHGITLFSQ